jgi:hypothetical protein
MAPGSHPTPWPADQIERRRVAQLIPYARNARRHRASQTAEIKASIKEWGWTVPISIDEANVIVAGYGRVLAAKRLDIAAAKAHIRRRLRRAPRTPPTRCQLPNSSHEAARCEEPSGVKAPAAIPRVGRREAPPRRQALSFPQRPPR